MSKMLTLSAEALVEVLLSDEARVVDIEVMEGKGHVSLGDGLSAIDSDSEELSVVDLTIMVEIDTLEDLSNFSLAHV